MRSIYCHIFITHPKPPQGVFAPLFIKRGAEFTRFTSGELGVSEEMKI